MAVKSGDKEIPKLFNSLTVLASNSNQPPEIQELALVLRKYISGVKNPDLSMLPKDIATIVQEAIQEDWQSGAGEGN